MKGHMTIIRYKRYFRLSRADSERRQVYDVQATAQKWWHNTPMADEALLPEAVETMQRECGSAWDDDDDVIDPLSEIEAAMHTISAEQFLIESAQDRLYVELGDQVYDI
jgi:hypothetical protein